MLPEDTFFKTLSSEELWRRYCGFLDLSTEQFLDIQRALLEEQLQLITATPLGQRILGNDPPKTLESFRRTVPISDYDDYEPELCNRNAEALNGAPIVWCHSSGRGGKFKWIPQSEATMDKTARNCIALFNLSAAAQKGDITVGPGMRLLTTVPPAPYASGAIFAHLRQRFTFRSLPPLETTATLSFREQIARAFELALREGFDVAGAIASVLVRMGEQMSGQAAKKRKLPLSALHPKALFRMIRAYRRSRSEKRSIYPKDLWRPKGIMAGGVDSSIYRKEIEKYWGVEPFDVYASTETMVLAMQSWTQKHLTFLPDSVFLEFLPYESDNGDSEPVLIDELEPGHLYEVIITQFHGMPLMRYRLGDVIRVVSIGDEEAGISLPQIEVRRKVGEEINLGGLCALDERTLWSAIADSGIAYVDWTAVKEYHDNEAYLRLIIELKEPQTAAEISILIDDRLKKIDTDYIDVERYLGVNPVRTTVLAPGTFARYIEAKVQEGADLAHLKPKHINPTEDDLSQLIGLHKVRHD